MEIEDATLNRNYLFSQKELKKKLGIKGSIQDIGLWAGLSPQDEEDGTQEDNKVYAFNTNEDRTNEEENIK